MADTRGESLEDGRALGPGPAARPSGEPAGAAGRCGVRGRRWPRAEGCHRAAGREAMEWTCSIYPGGSLADGQAIVPSTLS